MKVERVRVRSAVSLAGDERISFAAERTLPRDEAVDGWHDAEGIGVDLDEGKTIVRQLTLSGVEVFVELRPILPRQPRSDKGKERKGR